MVDKRALRAVQKSSEECRRDKLRGKPKTVDNLTQKNEILPKEEWLEDTKTYFKVIRNELKLLGVLYEIDSMQFYTAFDLYDEGIKIKNTVKPEDEDYIKKIRVYRELINECFKMLKDFFVSPASRMKAILDLQEAERKADKNAEAIELLKE